MARTAVAHNASMENASVQGRRHAQQAHTYRVHATRAWATQDNMHPLSRSTAVPQGLGEGDRKGSVCKSGGNRSNSWPSSLERCLRLHHQVDRPCTQTCQLHAPTSRDSAQHEHTQHEHTAHERTAQVPHRARAHASGSRKLSPAAECTHTHGHTQRTAWGAQTSAATTSTPMKYPRNGAPSSPSCKTKAYRAGTHTTGTRNAGMAAVPQHKTQACTAPRILWMHVGVDEKGDVGDGDEQSPQDLDERGAPSRCRRR